MKIDLETGLLDIAKQRPSPNCDERPAGEKIDLVVIHNISLPPNQFGGSEIEDFFCNQLDTTAHPYFEEIKGMQVSAHLLVNRRGKIIQFVPFNQRAWHAGESCYKDRECCNDFSIGIELEGSDDTIFTDKQYTALRKILGALSNGYSNKSKLSVVGHNEIAPGRKTDPGPFFDWDRVQKMPL